MSIESSLDAIRYAADQGDAVDARGVSPELALTPEQRGSWDRDGYLILRNCISREEVSKVGAIMDAQWDNREGNDHHIDVLTGEDASKTFRLQDASPHLRHEAYKLNNLFARIPGIREICLSPRLKAACTELLEGEPLICNSLNFERGSQQPYHIDSWYMPPPVEGRMVAASISLDDVDAANGPMTFYPGSHLIPAYRFSNGLLNEVPAEGPACRAYLDTEIASRGLSEVEFRGNAGDVFIWHGQLLHGGRPIQNYQRTRKSLVVHYWRACDLPAEQVRRHDGVGTYLGRTLRGEIQF